LPVVIQPKIAVRPAGDWRDQLICSKGRRDEPGGPKPLLANAITALRAAPEWEGVLAFDEFSLRTVALKPAPWDGAATGLDWTDHEDRLVANWLQHASIYVSVEVAGQSVQTVAKDRPFHPVREYLDSLMWDGTTRIDTWLTRYLGAEATEYTAAVGARWLISAVARIYMPGEKVDCCLILEGPQGIKKSMALRTMAHAWFTDEIAELGSKDSAMQTCGVWIIEIAELDSMRKAEVSKIKSFMSRSTDRYRPPYCKRLIESPRQCVFAGSVNHSNYLRDETGGRRFWPVTCTQIRIDELSRERDQLWAEARDRYRSGAPWWLDTVELNRVAQQQQADRYEGDAWDELVTKWVQSPSQRLDGAGQRLQPFTSDCESVTMADVLKHCIGKLQDGWSQSDMNRVGRCLRALGFERYKARRGAYREWRYRRE
jgi:predicted P-loop ATPase